jgi:hypothetical protein|tara:strand:+ start:4635 stop:4835 length:201 start_codon:yes stop_codon:yes gene_type:complete
MGSLLDQIKRTSKPSKGGAAKGRAKSRTKSIGSMSKKKYAETEKGRKTGKPARSVRTKGAKSLSRG